MKRASIPRSFGTAKALTAFALGLAALALPAPVSASQTFPGAIMDYLESTPGGAPACPPTCLLCHSSPAGGVESVRSTGFTDNLRGQSAVAFNMRNRMPPGALTGLDPTTVAPALKALETLDCASAPGNKCDSDGDKILDVQELRDGTNPDGPGTLGECPAYGCGASHEASIAPHATRRQEVPGAWLVAGLGLLVLARRRK